MIYRLGSDGGLMNGVNDKENIIIFNGKMRLKNKE
jgi:hypothetical protein